MPGLPRYRRGIRSASHRSRRPGWSGEAGAAADWRSQLPPDARQRIVNKIMETLKRHLPISVPEGINELEKIAVRFEEKVYAAATNQSDYLRKISLKMLPMESKTQTTAGMNRSPSNVVVGNQNTADSVQLERNPECFPSLASTTMEWGGWWLAGPGETVGAVDGGASADWRLQLQPEARQRIINKIMETLKRHLPVSVPEGINELKKIAVRFEEKIYTAATNQSDYLRKISLKMLSMESKSRTTAGMNRSPSNVAVGYQNTADSGTGKHGPIIGDVIVRPTAT